VLQAHEHISADAPIAPVCTSPTTKHAPHKSSRMIYLRYRSQRIRRLSNLWVQEHMLRLSQSYSKSLQCVRDGVAMTGVHIEKNGEPPCKKPVKWVAVIQAMHLKCITLHFYTMQHRRWQSAEGTGIPPRTLRSERTLAGSCKRRSRHESPIPLRACVAQAWRRHGHPHNDAIQHRVTGWDTS
jgi:hypothetical protein